MYCSGCCNRNRAADCLGYFPSTIRRAETFISYDTLESLRAVNRESYDNLAKQINMLNSSVSHITLQIPHFHLLRYLVAIKSKLNTL